VNGRRSADEFERRIRLHPPPYFDGRRLASISTADVNAFILKRQKDVIVVGEGDERQERRHSNGEINRELTTLKRIPNLARQNGKLTHVPHVPMLKERNVRTGFFEREQMDRVLRSQTSDRDGHNLGTVSPDRGSRLRVSLYISAKLWETPPGFEAGMEVLQSSGGLPHFSRKPSTPRRSGGFRTFATLISVPQIAAFCVGWLTLG